MKKVFVGVVIILVSTIVLLAFLNPSYASFKQFSSDITSNKKKAVYKRVFNGLIYSLYEKQWVTIDGYGTFVYGPAEQYYGFCLNFFRKN